MKPQKLTLLALFVSLSLVFSFVEAMLPMPLPGMKLGAANAFALTALVLYGPKEAFAVTIMRVLLAWLLTGNSFSLLCGLTGGFLSTSAMALIYTKFSELFSLPWISVAGAWAFNVGQLLAAAAIIGDARALYYLLPLILAGTAAGWAVGQMSRVLSYRLEGITGA